MIPPISCPANPVIAYKGIVKGLSSARIAAYSRPEDADSVDCFARYLWNMALVSAAWPAVHILEVVVRNAIYEVGEAETSGRQLTYGIVPCWLDAGILETNEQDDVQKAAQRLGAGRQTAGHLVAELSLGFWVRLCNSPYEHGRKNGPKIWPEAAKRFWHCPRKRRNREDIRTALNERADFRNRLAHHHPIWDRRPDKRWAEVVETVGWLSPELETTLLQTSNFNALYNAGHTPFRPLAEGLCSVYV